MPGPTTWPQWSEAEIDDLELRYINDIIACGDQYSAFVAVAFSHYLVNKIGLNPDNYTVYFRLLESGNRHVVDALAGKGDPARFFGNIQPNTFMLKECFRMLTKWSPGGIYPKALLIIYGLLTVCFKDPEEGYRLYPLSVTDVNNLGKHLNKETGQDDPNNRCILDILDRTGSLAGTSNDPDKEQMARQANNIRTFYFDKRKKMEDIIPQVLLVKSDYVAKETAPRQLFVD